MNAKTNLPLILLSIGTVAPPRIREVTGSFTVTRTHGKPGRNDFGARAPASNIRSAKLMRTKPLDD